VHWKIAQRNSSALGSGRSSARAEISPIFVDKWTDAASPYLALACMQAKSFEEVVLLFRKDSGDAHLDYLKITMTNVIISSFEMLNEYKEEEEPILMIPERIGLSCEKINIVYTVQADDHSAGDEHEVEYDITKGA
jgi:type VI secretion system secreted protein Hcp